MKLFKNRFNEIYRNDLLNHLKLNGKEGLIKNAIKIKKPFIRNGITYSKVARIDFIGLSGTTIFDVGSNFNDSKIAEQIEYIFDNIDKLNSKGIFLKFRVLLTYPYSDYSFSIIQAETSKIRSSVTEPEFFRDFKLIEEVDEKKFWGASTVTNQQHSLSQLEELCKKIKGDNINDLRVRFTPTQNTICMLLINNTGYIDSYLLAKEKRASNKLSFSNPIMKISSVIEYESFKAYEEHFRYLWTLDTTLYCSDATKFDYNDCSGLTDIIPPNQITFDNKAEIIKKRLLSENADLIIDDDEVNAWKFKLTHLLHQSTQLTRISPKQETLFITCSWKEDKSKKEITPNPYAKNLTNWLNRDFGIKSPRPCMKINILEATIGDNLFPQIYNTLDDSTVAIILMTKDIKSDNGIHYCKPNVYHELGYLMKHLSNTNRVAVLLEEGVFEPSNIKGLVRVEFNENNFDEKYLKLLRWLEKAKTFVNKSCFNKAIKNHKLK